MRYVGEQGPEFNWPFYSPPTKPKIHPYDEITKRHLNENLSTMASTYTRQAVLRWLMFLIQHRLKYLKDNS